MSSVLVSGAQRILIGSPAANLRVTLLDQDGEAAAASGAVTVDLARADGTALASGRSATAMAPAGEYVATLAAAECSVLDVLSATWKVAGVTVATTAHRIVGGFLFSPAEVRALPGCANVSPALVRHVRDAVTDLFESVTSWSWVPSYDLVEVSGSGRCAQLVPDFCRPIRSVRSISFDGAAQSVAGLTIDNRAGIIDHPSWWPAATVITLGLEHGQDAPPADLRDAAVALAGDRLKRLQSGLGDRTRSISTDLGTQTFSFAGGRGHWTGLDDVDAVLLRYDRTLPGLA